MKAKIKVFSQPTTHSLVDYPCVSPFWCNILVFYVPETTCGASERIKTVIENHGGLCCEFHECQTTQIKPDVPLNFNSFYEGKIYHESFIYECIANNKLEKFDSYYINDCTAEKGQKLNIGKRKIFTIMEGIKLYLVFGSKKTKQIQQLFWKNLETNKVLPERSLDRIKAFWLKYEDTTLEHYLCECIHNKVDFCLSFKEIPQLQTLEKRLRI